MRRELCVYPAGVQESFPDDVWLKKIAAQCYLGLPLYSSAGEVIGHLGVIRDQPLDNVSFAEHVVRAVAAQASPELERMQKAGLPRIRFHDLRHSAATLLLGQGVHPKIVSEMLGHSNVATTLDLYSHVTPTMQQAAVEALDTVLSG